MIQPKYMISLEEFQTETASCVQANGQILVLIPAFEGERTISSLVRAIAAQGLPVLVIDDGSSDNTTLAAELSGAAVISRTQNGGKGRALREGFQAALKQNVQWILTMDADGQHLPQEIERFTDEAARSQADMIVGNRMGDPNGMPLIRRLTNHFMSWLISVMIQKKIPDSQCGFRLISRRVLEGIKFSSDAFEIESEILVKVAWSGFSIASVSVSSVYDRQTSFIHPLRDTFRFIKFLISLKRCPSPTAAPF